MKLFRARAALLLLVAAPLLGGAPAPPPDVEAAARSNNVGVALLEQFRHEEAVAAFRTALRLDPGLALARANLAIALLNAGQHAEARTEAEAAARLLPQAPQPPYVAGLAARSVGETEAAKAAFRRVLEMDAADVGAHVNLGQLLMQERQYAEAAAEFRAAAGADPFSTTAIYNLGQALVRAGEAAAGQKELERFRVLREAGYGTALGQAYAEQGRYAEAIVTTGAEPGRVDAATPPVRFADVTAARLGAASGAAREAALADLDGDGRLDLVAAGDGGVRLFLNRGARLEDVTASWKAPALADVAGILAADLDADARPDLILLRTGGLTLLRNEGTALADQTAAAGLPVVSAGAAALADADHDGDLDLVVADAAAPRLFLNDGTARFKESAAARLEGPARGAAVVATDYDDRRDVDLLVVAPGERPRLFQNRRDGSFADVAGEVGLARVSGARAVAAGDVNKDGFTDLYLGVAEGPDQLALSDGRGRFVVADAPAGASGTRRVLLLDYDNDGLLDVLAVGARGARLLRNLGTAWVDVTAAAFAAAPPAEAALAAGDLDGDGDTDLVLAGGPLRVLDNAGGRNRSLPVRLAGTVSNRSGVGAKIEMRAGSLRQKLETHVSTPAAAPADVVFGLGTRAGADAVRVLWPSGTLQAELVAAAPAGAATMVMAVKELDRKPSSCPFLYAWNGTRFEFVTDFMGGGEIGYWQGPGRYNRPDPDEYVRVRADQLAPRAGRYELRVTNELEEALFLDRLALLAVAHPEDVEVFPAEGLRSEPPAFRLVGVRAPRPLRGAWGHRGRDVSARLAAADRVFVDGLPLHRIRGYAAEHALVLDLGAEAGEDAVLLLSGWTDYAFSSDNVAAHQAGVALHPPRLEVEDAAGAWHVAMPEIGIPVGRPQTIVVPMAGRWRGPSRRVRIVTSMRVYWDQARVGTAVPAPAAEPVGTLGAELRERGFSAEVFHQGLGPLDYDYQRVSRASPWKEFPGAYTREGDVRELLAGTDDLFVLSRPGDEIALSFAEGAPLPPGWTRTFLLYADGYSKEMDINSATPHTLGPLPYHGMPSYPYAPPAAYPLTPERQAVMERYNTRLVRAPLARLERLDRAGEAP